MVLVINALSFKTVSNLIQCYLLWLFTLGFLSAQELVDSLHSERNTPTVLQSLGCLSQHSVLTFAAHDGEITPFIYERILQVIFCTFFFFSHFVNTSLLASGLFANGMNPLDVFFMGLVLPCQVT